MFSGGRESVHWERRLNQIFLADWRLFITLSDISDEGGVIKVECNLKTLLQI